MKSKVIISVIVAIVLSSEMLGQTPLGLHECVQIAVERNISMDNARSEKEKSAYKVTETRVSYLPQISGSGSFTNQV